jgi:multiple sugar transport system substrate-binding protein
MVDTRVGRRELLHTALKSGAAVAGSSLLLGSQGCATEESDRDSAGNLIVSVWHPWGGTMTSRVEKVLAAYEKAHPEVKLRVVFTPNNLANNQKFFTSVAANKPPDVIFVDGPQVAEWAEQGALQPLDSYMAAAGIGEKHYFPPCWRQCFYRGQTYSLTFCADPNFAFAWNKDDFRQAGLDPERPPRTLAEMDQMSKQLTKLNGGKMERVGIIPWEQYGRPNSMFTWGWAFGGSFYDDRNHRVTANDPKVVQALEWMVRYSKEYDITRVSSLQQGFGTAALDPFYVGQMSMRCLHLSGVDDIGRYAPDLKYGLAFIPAPDGGEQHSSWVGGWCMGIPSGSRHPKEGFELIRWLCADNEGTRVAGSEMGLMPGYRNSPAFADLRSRPGFEQFYKILVECRHQRPVMPVQAYYMGSLQRAVDAALYGKKSPKQALDDAAAETQAELDVVLKDG